MSSVDCIFVNYKQPKMTLEAVHSLKKLQGSELRKTIVVDNESESSEQLRNADIELIESKSNLGFAGAVNLGAESLAEDPPDYIWLLNNDALAEADALQELVRCADANNAAVVGSLIFYGKPGDTNPRIWTDRGKLYSPWFIVQHSKKGQDKSAASAESSSVSFVTGCSMLIRYSVFQELSGFDQSLFLYGEDVDFCYRAIQSGHKLYFTPQSVVWHLVSQSTGGEFNPFREYYQTRNGHALIWKHQRFFFSKIATSLMRLPWDFYRVSKSFAKAQKLPFGAIPLCFRAFWNGARGALGPQSL